MRKKPKSVKGICSMKGTVFLKPLEYNIETSGEKWRQGEKIKGSLKIKNNGVESIELPAVKIALSIGNYKKVKVLDVKAWDLVSEVTLSDQLLLKASEEKEFPWEFQLAEDCRITDKDGSIYLRFLNLQADLPAGNIELLIQPKLVMLQFLEIFDNFLRFKIGPMKFSKGMVEVKLTPPSSRELGHIDSLVLRMSEIQNTLKLEYLFNLRVLEMTGTTMTAEKKTKSFDQTLNSKQYYSYGSPDQEFIIASINKILIEVKPRMSL